MTSAPRTQSLSSRPILRRTLVTVSLRLEAYDDTVRLLDHIEDSFDIELLDLTAIPEYDGFVQSPQYSVWMRSR